MEPCLNPATETQALGRIHRMGQQRNVKMKKFVYADSVESNIVELHKEIEAGRIEIRSNHVPANAVKVLSAGLSFSS